MDEGRGPSAFLCGCRCGRCGDAALARTGGGPLPVLHAFVDEVAAGGWATLNLDGRLTVALPTSLLVPGPESLDHLEYRGPHGSLVFRVVCHGPEDAWAMHDRMLGACGAGGALPQRVRRPLLEGPCLGEPVLALGFPFLGAAFTANQGLSVTGGNVSALPRVADAWSRVMISTPVQPGDSGGPLLGADGAVPGVVVSRIDDL